MNAAELQNRIVELFLSQSPQEQATFLRSLLWFVDARIQDQLYKSLQGQGGTPVDAAGIALVEPTGCGPERAAPVAPLGRNADFASVPFQSSSVASVRPAPLSEGSRALVLMEEMIARRRPRKPKAIRVVFPPGSAVSPEEICHRLEISREALNREIATGRFPRAFKIAGRLRWRWTDIETWVSALNSREGLQPFLPVGTSGRIVSSHLDREIISLADRVAVELKGAWKGGETSS